ncbi:hypothetical protein HIM_05940 [Hirsutella minnesotensis 3608]|uniref:alpha-1,2-Mannosidase n=1 Tax=Hirsutella minnesotensis 3608 TaxID=1043627 RepID=A0A0F7ZNZ1_9HYPO|nr:hypothetical protein HIM_05940 [Hirsutella minnesotensis 3608]
MRFAHSLVLLWELAGTALAHPQRVGPLEQNGLRSDPIRAEAIKRAFEHSWQGYLNYTFPHDTLHPLSHGFEDDRSGWGVTAVDALSTAIIMGETRIVDQILDHVAKVDFTTTSRANDQLSLFETNIRYLAGLISGYDLLQGPMRNMGLDQRKVDLLLSQAESLADTLSFAFDTPSGIPDPVLTLNPARRISGSSHNSIAEVGTLVLEWTRLSDLTRNPKYAKLVQKAESYLLRPSGSPEPFPGMVGTTVSTANGQFLDSDGGWSGGTDSFYEYLIKMYQYDPVAFAEYRDRWILAADSTISHLASHPSSRRDLTYLLQYSGRNLDPVSSHLASFAGGNFILGGVILGEEKYKKFGLDLTNSYFNNYIQTPAGIGPEIFRWQDPSKTKNGGAAPQSQRDFYKKAGFWSAAGTYILRPETLESVYYAYRMTGDKKYQDMAWRAFESINRVCRVEGGFAELADVMQSNGGGYIDQMQSFWLAETLKYLYLIFGPESSVQLQLQGGARSEFVFNTEAHPLRVR